MKTIEKVLEYISKNSQVKPSELIKYFWLSKAIIHRHLNKLLEEWKIEKNWKAPNVSYFIKKQNQKKEIIKKLKSLKEIFDRNHIKHLHLTGSFARSEANKESDIDLIISVEKWARFTLFNIWDLKFNLEKKLWTEVDLVLEDWIKKEFKPYLEKDKVIVF